MRKLFTLGRVILAIGSIHAAHGAELDGRRICEHWESYAPADHTIIRAPGWEIDCHILSKEAPIVVKFESLDRLAWWQDHALQRVILPGEGPND